MEAVLEILTTEDMTELRQGIKNLILNAVESDFNALNEHIVPPNFVIEVIDDVIDDIRPKLEKKTKKVINQKINDYLNAIQTKENENEC